MTEIRIHKQRRKSMVMKLTPVGVVVFIPQHLNEHSRIVQQFIRDGLAKLGERTLPTDEVTAPDALKRLLHGWAAVMGVQPKRVQIRDMYRKWGSCSSVGSITLNSALCRVPQPLAEYVVVHELVHLTIFNHGTEFKAAMTHWLPDWRERERALNALLGGKPD